jgi:hypothetical protein
MKGWRQFVIIRPKREGDFNKTYFWLEPIVNPIKNRLAEQISYASLEIG